MKKFFIVVMLTYSVQHATAQANKNLSNLTSPTAVNIDLLPKTDSAINIGNSTKSWNNFYLKGKLYFGNITGMYSTVDDFFAGPGAGSIYNYQEGRNTGIGKNALFYGGYSNTGIGWKALATDSMAEFEVAVGALSLLNDESGTENVAVGNASLYKNINGSYNVGIGSSALQENFSGKYNVAVGAYSLGNAYKSEYNTAIGYHSQYSATTAQKNTSLGYNTGSNLKTGTGNIFIGYNTNCGSGGALTNSTAIGNGVSVTVSNSFIFGNASVTAWGFGTAAGSKAIKVGSSSLNGNGAYLTACGTRTNTSARSKKEDFQKQDRNAILKKISQLEITKWKYKGTADEYHYGPMADDFHRLFTVGDDSSVSDMDKTGILFLGMQQLIKMNDDKDSIIHQQNNKINDLESRLEKLETLMTVQSEGSSNTQIAILNNASLQQNIPNPFTNTTTIAYSLPSKFSSAKIVIADKNGKQLKQLMLSNAGKGTVHIDASTLASGAYNYALYVDGRFVASKQMIAAK